MNCAIIVPVYNEEQTIVKIWSEVYRSQMHFVFVNDGSTDLTYPILKDIQFKLPFNMVSYYPNKGKGYAIKKGAEHLITRGYDWIIVMDSDGQSDIKDILNILKLRDTHPKAKILMGNRLNTPQNMPLIRFLANKIMSFTISLLSGQRIPDSQCWLKIIHKDVFALQLQSDRFDFESEMLIKAGRKGYEIVSKDIDCIYYKDTKSKMHPIKDALRFIKLIVKLLFR